MSAQKSEAGHPKVTLPKEQSNSQDDTEASDCPLLSPSPTNDYLRNAADLTKMFQSADNKPIKLKKLTKLEDLDYDEDGLAFLKLVNSSRKSLRDEPTSRDPMVETSSSSGSSTDTKEPVCTQLLTQLNTAYTHLAPDAQALFSNSENVAQLVGIQLVVPKPPKNYIFTNWNWPLIRKVCFWSLMSLLMACAALVVGVISTMPKRCDPSVEWWQGSLFYEINLSNSSNFQEISSQLDHLQKLGVRGVRLGSIFTLSSDNVNYSTNIKLGTPEDLDILVLDIHKKNMAIILDLPLHPFVRNLDDAILLQINKSESQILTPDKLLTPETSSLQAVTEALAGIQIQQENATESNLRHPIDDNVVTKALRFWAHKKIDGFYLKGLEHLVHDDNFPTAVKYWKEMLGSRVILICGEEALNAAPVGLARGAILNRIDLVKVGLRINNGTKNLRSQVMKTLKGILFEKPSYPWILWSTDMEKSNSEVNSVAAVAMMKMMLPGTPNVIDLVDKLETPEFDEAQDKDPRNFMPLTWEVAENDTSSKYQGLTWIPKTTESTATANTAFVEMSNLRAILPAIYVKAVTKHNEAVANCDVRYATDDVVVIERWYPRRNTLVFVANFGTAVKTKDLSSLYYAGHAVVGPRSKLNKDIYFKELTILPGEVLIIKLDK